MDLPNFRRVRGALTQPSVRFPIMLNDPRPLLAVANALQNGKDGHFEYTEPEIDGSTTIYITFAFIPSVTPQIVD